MRQGRCFLTITWILTCSLAWSPAPAAIQLDPLVQVSGATTFANCRSDTGQFGTVYIGSEVEPWVGVNPVDPLHIVGTWQQDRWSNGGARGLVAGVSIDGGITWESVVIPGLSKCSGAPQYNRTSDPWLAFAANGDLYHIALSFNNVFNAILVSRSTDGGFTWDNPRPLIQNASPFFNDKESITADPGDPDRVYAAWDRLDFARNLGPALLSRTQDGGQFWDAPRIIHDPGTGRQTLGNQVAVQPDGTVLLFFTEILGFGPASSAFLAFKRSVNAGNSFQPASGAFRVRRMQPQTAIEPDSRRDIRDGALLFDVAVDPRNSRAYAVWQDGGLTGFQHPVVAFSMSLDGLSWTNKSMVNQTPDNPSRFNRQAFLPSVHVSANGTVGITYYDFRFNDGSVGAATDHWFIWCHPEAMDCTQRSRWRHEARLTDASFDFRKAPFANGLFLGDYVGLSSAGDDFIAFFTQTHGLDRSSVFARRIILETAVEPRGLGFWKHQVRALRSGRGRVQESESSLLEYLSDIQALYNLFDGLEGLQGLESVLAPPPPAAVRQRGRQHLLALLLNLTSFRLPPFVEVEAGATVSDTIAALVDVLEDPASDSRALQEAKELAEALNEGRLPLDR